MQRHQLVLVGIKCFALVCVCKVAGESDFEIWVRDQKATYRLCIPQKLHSRHNDWHTFVADLQFPHVVSDY